MIDDWGSKPLSIVCKGQSLKVDHQEEPVLLTLEC